jgi:hypothetical protein
MLDIHPRRLVALDEALRRKPTIAIEKRPSLTSISFVETVERLVGQRQGCLISSRSAVSWRRSSICLAWPGPKVVRHGSSYSSAFTMKPPSTSRVAEVT